jgi:hypothetical protein
MTRPDAAGVKDASDAAAPGLTMLAVFDNLAEYHREHEKYHSEAPLHEAAALQRSSRTLKALAERWSAVHPTDSPLGSPFAGAPDLNDSRAIETSGVLFMESGEAPVEIMRIRRELSTAAANAEETGRWLSSAMDAAWSVAAQLLRFPELSDLLGERHSIIANDWRNASMLLLIGRQLTRANAILDCVDFAGGALRADLRGPRRSPGYLFSAAELIDQAADLNALGATLVHQNERRWRVFRQRLEQVLET